MRGAKGESNNGKRAFPHNVYVLALIGLSCAWAIVFEAEYFFLFCGKQELPSLYFANMVFEFAGFLAATLAFIGALRRDTRIRVTPMVCGGGLFVFGVAVSYLSTTNPIFPVLVGYLGNIAQGASCALYSLLWVQVADGVFGDRFEKALLVTVSAGSVLVFCIFIVYVRFETAGLFASFSALAAVSAAAFFRVRSLGGIRKENERFAPPATNPYCVPLELEYTLFAAGFALTLVLMLASDTTRTSQALLAQLFVLVAFVLATYFFLVRKNTDDRLRLCAKAAAPAMLLALLVHLLFPDLTSYLAAVVGFFGFHLCVLCALVYIGRIADRRGASKAYAFSLGLGSLFGGCIVFGVLAVLVGLVSASDTEAFDLATKMMILVSFVMLLVATVVFDIGKISSLWSPEPAHRQWSSDEACTALAESFGLTERQGEVLLLLIRGKKARDIEKELTISNGTVRSHILSIYRKCNVHSLSELMALVYRADQQ